MLMERNSLMSVTMKAYVYHRYGGPEVVQLESVPKPMPGRNEILIRIRATTVTAGDWRVRTLTVPRGFGVIARLAIGVRGPRQTILGTELAGLVEDVGKDVTRFRVGNAVLAFPGGKMGSHAEYRVIAEDGPVALKPERLSFEEAASLPFGASTAMHFLGKADLRRGERILVIGASGGVGIALVQLAKHMKARVTAVTSTRNVELVRSMGADDVIDYTREELTRTGATYDVIADTVGETHLASCSHLLDGRGRFLAIAGGMHDMLDAMRTMRSKGKRVIAGPADERPEYVSRIAQLAESGELRPVIDRQFDFSQMREAHAHVDTKRKRGSVVVTLPSE